ncbi:para-nitrobenzyl esterase [Arthrobacter sp. AG367]|uniref:carboxylesterase family protein n=1 Tax=Arthrobacter sp. AG367 TaxID=2572909 RepID=UPI0011A7C565|nr:carboxylesterase family protein [Arthrobacter sp. AG367]TWD48084.1 para-nitrobenzyl esterase [Arthrobacter sp. AG367]
MKFLITEGYDRTASRGPVPRKVAAFYGIRYASLTGGRRFSPPAPVHDEEQLDVGHLTDVPIFPSQGSGLEAVLGCADAINPQSEEAFFLNVWAPDGADRLPVLVFLHGGAWTSGGGSLQWYDGRHLAAGGLVVVTVNYRLGPLAHLTAPSENGRPTQNRPVQDLITALTWVQDNIGRFGGNPDRVTLAGQSAGGWYVHLLNVLPEARGLFDKIALWSMGTRTPRPAALQSCLHTAANRILAPQRLETAPVPQLLEAGEQALKGVLPPAPFGYAPAGYLPHVADNVPADLLNPDTSAKRCNAKAIYARYTAEETGSFFHNVPALRNADSAQVQQWLDKLPAGTLPGDLVNQRTFQDKSPYEKVVAASSWIQYKATPTAMVNAYKAADLTAQIEEFTYKGAVEGQLSGHCIDLPFQFGTLEEWSDAPMLKDCGDDVFDALSHILIRSLTTFASSPTPPFSKQR